MEVVTVVDTTTTTIITAMATADITTDILINAVEIHLDRVRMSQWQDSVRVRNAPDQYRQASSFVPPVGRVLNQRLAKVAARNCRQPLPFAQIAVLRFWGNFIFEVTYERIIM